MFAQYAESESVIISMRTILTNVTIASLSGTAGTQHGAGWDKVIQRILRHANVSTTLGYYVKSQPQDALDAMTKLEKAIPENSILPDTQRTLSGNLTKRPASIQ
jgi:hypothetical protein